MLLFFIYQFTFQLVHAQMTVFADCSQVLWWSFSTQQLIWKTNLKYYLAFAGNNIQFFLRLIKTDFYATVKNSAVVISPKLTF